MRTIRFKRQTTVINPMAGNIIAAINKDKSP
jgi:hypothetical protein